MVRHAIAYRPIGLLLVLAMMGLLAGATVMRPSPVGVVSAAEAGEGSVSEWLLIRLRGDAPAHEPAASCMSALLTAEAGAPRAAVLVSSTDDATTGCGS